MKEGIASTTEVLMRSAESCSEQSNKQKYHIKLMIIVWYKQEVSSSFSAT